MSIEHRGTKALELWTRRVTTGYEGVVITNMTTSWRNGLAFCALIHHFRPELIEFQKLKSENVLENNALAFRVAEQQLGIPALLDAEDMIDSEVPDRLSILTYVSQFYQAFSAQGLIGPGGRLSPLTSNVIRKASAPGATPSSHHNKTSPIISTVCSKPISQPPASIQTKTEKPEFKTDKVAMGVRGRREVCFVCSKPVFIAERLSIGFPGQLRHRTCFKCDRCSAQLTLASYYETEKSQFCCETCPDEERAMYSEVEKETSQTTMAEACDKSASSYSESDSQSISSEENEERLEETSSDQARSQFLRQTLSLGKTTPHSSAHPSKDNSEHHSGSNHCDLPSAQISAETFPPNNILDTGQNNSKEKFKSNIVLNRLKLFENISKLDIKQPKICSKDVNISNAKNNSSEDIAKLICDENIIVSPQESTGAKNSETDEIDIKSTISDSEKTTYEVGQSPPPKPKRLIVDDESIKNVQDIMPEINFKVVDTEPPTMTCDSERQDVAAITENKSTQIATPENSETPVISDEVVFLNPETYIEEIITPLDSVNDITNPFGSTDDEEEEEKKPASVLAIEVKYPEEFNPFDSGSETEISVNESQISAGESGVMNPFEEDLKQDSKKSLNPFISDDEEHDSSYLSTDSKKKIPPPRPPPPIIRKDDLSSPKRLLLPPSNLAAPPSPSLSLSSNSSEMSALRLKKKLRLAPAPPGINESDRQDLRRDDGLSVKMQKDLLNQTNKLLGTTGLKDDLNTSSDKTLIVAPKSERGEWRRKKGPAPLLPVPEKRYIRKLPMRQVQQELSDIEIKQTELERQGVLLETTIRDRTESPGNANNSTEINYEAQSNPEAEKSLSSISSNSSTQNSIEVEDMILQLFELVNEKNELFRRQTELMYIKREKRLEEEYAELEYQIRCLMIKVRSERTDDDIALEEELITRLVKLVEQRDEIVNCLEMERQREVVEDESIATHLIKYQEKHIDGIDSDDQQIDIKKKRKKIRLMKKKKKKDKEKITKIDADKDIDESELKKKKKKNWFKKPQLPS